MAKPGNSKRTGQTSPDDLPSVLIVVYHSSVLSHAQQSCKWLHEFTLCFLFSGADSFNTTLLLTHYLDSVFFVNLRMARNHD